MKDGDIPNEENSNVTNPVHNITENNPDKCMNINPDESKLDLPSEKKSDISSADIPNGENDGSSTGKENDNGECSSTESGSSEEPSESAEQNSESNYDELVEYLRGLGIFGKFTEEKHEKVLSDLTIEGIADHIKKCKNILVMTGAGISTSAGIPDFRSPGTGLYSKLEKYNLPYPEAIFQLDYFKENPEPFFLLAKELYPGNFKPTPSHYFIKLLEKKNLLLRNYTQNIDGLEIVAGVHPNAIIAAHGSFHTSHCVACKKAFEEKWMKSKIFATEIPRCPDCGNLVKPDIVFFGENLPDRFFSNMGKDFRKADLLIVMGTSLTVQPFASLINRVGDHVPRLLINKEKCGQSFFSGGFNFDGANNYRDVAWLGTCDDGCRELSRLLGWEDDLDALISGTSEDRGKSSSDENTVLAATSM